MGYEVDTDEVRRVARAIKGIAEDVKSLSTSNVRSMQNSVEDNLRGETAQALTEVLADLSSDIAKIGSGLDSIQKALYDYARRVEKADREAEEKIRNS